MGWRRSDPARVESFQRTLSKGRRKTSARAVSRYTTTGPDGELQVISDPPFVEPISELSDLDEAHVRAAVEGILAEYRTSLPDDLKVLLDGYRVVDAARKVVGVGSVGTRCWIALLVGDERPLRRSGAAVQGGQRLRARVRHRAQRV